MLGCLASTDYDTVMLSSGIWSSQDGFVQWEVGCHRGNWILHNERSTMKRESSSAANLATLESK